MCMYVLHVFVVHIAARREHCIPRSSSYRCLVYMCVHMVWAHGKAGSEHYVFSSVRRLASKRQGSPYLYLLACQQCSQLLCGCSRQETSPSAHAASALVAKPHSHPHGEPFKACIHYDTSSFWHPSTLLACLPTVTEQSHPISHSEPFGFCCLKLI